MADDTTGNVGEVGGIDYKAYVLSIYPDAMSINTNQIYQGKQWVRDKEWFIVILRTPWRERRELQYLGRKGQSRHEAWKIAYEWILNQTLSKLED